MGFNCSVMPRTSLFYSLFLPAHDEAIVAQLAQNATSAALAESRR
jgi:hypothetical protein